MALDRPYCSIAQVHDELRNADATIDSQLELCIGQASRYIDDYKGRDYYLHDYSSTPLKLDKYDGAYVIGDTVFLPYRPIIVLTSITVAGTLWVLDTDYIVKSDRIGDRIVSLKGNFKSYLCTGTDRISIVGKFGYDQAASTDVPTGLPAHINKAAILIAAAFSGHNQKTIVGLDGAKTEVIDKMIPKTALALLGTRRSFI
jgi:hypothetical protein